MWHLGWISHFRLNATWTCVAIPSQASQGGYFTVTCDLHQRRAWEKIASTNSTAFGFLALELILEIESPHCPSLTVLVLRYYKLDLTILEPWTSNPYACARGSLECQLCLIPLLLYSVSILYCRALAFQRVNFLSTTDIGSGAYQAPPI